MTSADGDQVTYYYTALCPPFDYNPTPSEMDGEYGGSVTGLSTKLQSYSQLSVGLDSMSDYNSAATDNSNSSERTSADGRKVSGSLKKNIYI